MFQQQRALGGAGSACVATGAERVQVLRHPAHAHRFLCPEQTAPSGQHGAQAGKFGQCRHAHEVGPQVHDQRGLDRTAVQPVGQLIGLEQPRRHAERETVCASHQQAVRHAQPQRGQVDVRALTTVAVEDHQLLHAGPRHAAPDTQPQAEQRFQVGAERARKSRVLQAVADIQRRQHQHRSRSRQALQRVRHHRLVDQCVGAQWQVRAVLFDGGHRQQRDGAPGVDAGEIGGGQVLPISTGQGAAGRVVGGCCSGRKVHRHEGVR